MIVPLIRLLFIYGIASLFFCLGCFAQRFPNTFEKLTTQNGLSQNDVRALLQDSKGYIWIGTHDGLNQYNGYEVNTYRKELGNPYSLRSSLIGNICEDSLGNIWVGTDDEGVSMLNRKNGKFYHFRNTSKTPNLLSNNHITDMIIDDAGHIWCGTPIGLNKMTVDYETNTVQNQIFINDPENYNSINNNRITTLFQDKLGNIWIGNSRGLTRYIENHTNGDGQFIYYDTGPTAQISHIIETGNSLIINSYNPFELPFREINKTNPVFTNIARYSTYKLVALDDNTLWGTTNNGINVYTRTNQQKQRKLLTTLTHQWGDASSLSANITTDIIIDKSGIIWVGTNGGGVNIYNPNKKNFKHYSRNENPGSLSYNKIRSIFEDEQQNLWIGTEGGGFNFLSKDQPKNYSSGFQRIDVNPSGQQNYVYAIEEFKSPKENTILMGAGYSATFQSGTVSEMSKGDFRTGPNIIKPQGVSFSLLVDNKNQMWAGTYQNGLYRYLLNDDGTIYKVDTFFHDNKILHSISSNIIRSMAQDHSGNIWIGTDNGLNKLLAEEIEKKDPKFIRYVHDENYKYSISHDYILPILVTSKNQIWVGTLGGGLNKVLKGNRPDNDQFLSYTTLDGLPNNSIKAILEADDGYLWLSSNKGLTKFSPEKLEFRTFGIKDGLQDIEFSEMAACKRQDGELLFGGVNGFNAFYPSEIKSDSFNVDLAFGGLQVVNQNIGIGDTLNGRIVLDQDINYTQNLTLNYHENSFSIGFSTLHYAAPDQNKYAYMLDGFDKNWIYTSYKNRNAKYTNLPSGNYTLKVKATNSDGHWSNKELSLGIIIRSPWWFTPWAISLYVMVGIIGLWFFRKYTIITNSRKNQYLMEHFEKEKIEELSQLKLRFFTNISHEFRTPLTLIIGFIERLKGHSANISENDRQKYYQNIFRNSKVLLNLINQLMGFRKVEQGKMKLRVSYNDLTSYISLLGENFYELANKKNIDFNVVSEERILAWFDAEIIERVMFNLLSNAFKFTPENGKISVRISTSGDHIHIEVKDNGKGIPREIQSHLFERFANTSLKGETGSGIGLSFVKSLMEIHHGDISYETKLNAGTSFKVVLPVDKDTYSEEEVLTDSGLMESLDEAQNWLVPSENEDKKISLPRKNKDQTLLIVEDNEDILFFLEENFKDTYNIHLAREGSEALDTCLSQNIDLVISDIMMEGMNGFDFCQKLKSDERINHIPIILLTAKDSSENKIKGYALGADAYIAKPFSLEELETRLNALLESRKTIINKFRSNIDLSPSEVGLTSIDEKFLNRVMSYIEENISSSEFSVEMLARECGLSQIHLNKKLKALVGSTANSFIRNIRMKRAAQLLKKNMYSVTEIMYEVGFNDAKYFRDCFKKEFEMTPTDYQKAELNEETNT